MIAHGVVLSPELIAAVAAHAEATYPKEACGVILGRPGAPDLVRVVPLENVQDHHHHADPVAFPRDGRDAFRIDERERIRVLDQAEGEGLVERVLFHSHCDAGAYFSPEDRAMAVQQGVELLPGVVHLVVSVRKGRRSDAAAFCYDPKTGAFLEVRLPPELLGLAAPPELLPHLELRALDNHVAVRPIRPYGGPLVPRRVDAAEQELLWSAIEGAPVALEPEALAELLVFGAGGFSPLQGYLRKADLRSISQRGRTIAGVPWREPILLQVPKPHFPKHVHAGGLLGLTDAEGTPVGLVAVTEVTPGKERVGVAGPVYVFSGAGHDQLSATDTRAELLRRGAQRVVALLGPGPYPELDAFDQRLAIDPAWSPGALALPNAPTPWLRAVIAQNFGATHFWLPKPERVEWIRDEALATELWPKV